MGHAGGTIEAMVGDVRQLEQVEAVVTRTLAMERGRYGIRVNCISPGPIETEGVKTVL
jgi:NAD(P)-dependent dehydrogenase (short-subunit alcohol dehydrogenase family)